jgi:2,4-dienoyl-CoA reductase-like NADH-dependent reductase (Old Yellow Enzyme family)
MSDPLFTPLQAGAFRIPNRIIMAPLTRCRAAEGRVPNRIMADYYAQRASFGMILSEATSVCPMGVGYPDTPGIWSEAQVAGWREVTREVHEAGGTILLQLWHVGRISDPVYLDGGTPVSASAVRPAGHVSLMRPQKPFEMPRALALEEIPGIIRSYHQGAEYAMAAGFDGVEIHAANGYLIDQFLQDSTNQRTDAYGGPIENRARLLLEVTDAVNSVWGADRVGVHLAPRCDAHDMGDSAPAALFGHVARELGKRRLAFLCARESLDHPDVPALSPMMKREFGGVFIANEGFTAESARKAVASGSADAVAFGKAAIANPDLVDRIRTGAEWNVPDADSFYGGGDKGYLDYPFIQPSSNPL